MYQWGKTMEKYSILYPAGEYTYRTLDPVTMHDLGMDQICKKLSAKEAEQNLFFNILSSMSDDPAVTQYRLDAFEDILKHPKMRDDLMQVLGRISFLHDYGRFQRDYDEKASVWELLHRLEELKDYIDCVDALFGCLSEANVKSEALTGLYSYVEKIYKDNGFAELKKDITALKASTSNLKSVTVGINLNERWEAESIGLISVNAKQFTKSGALKNFYEKLMSSANVHENTEWNEDYKYQPFGVDDTLSDTKVMRVAALANPMLMAMASVAEKDDVRDVTKYMDNIVGRMLSGMVKKIRETLNKYVTITITDLTDLMPEFAFYIAWAEFIGKLQSQGYTFCKPAVNKEGGLDRVMQARGLYNLKLAALAEVKVSDIVVNDLDFDEDHRLYILTGANRGGKTTITQAVGQLFLMAQSGIYVPASEFIFDPVDMMYTHFPADEDKTMDLGRLGEECKRFREMFEGADKNSLLLLNETFSTTSFEEGYYIARDAVKAILHKGIRTIYNTHMHKLAFDIEEINAGDTDGKASSLTVMSEEGKRSYKVEVRAPGGKSYAEDIARKYGVTFDMLIKS